MENPDTDSPDRVLATPLLEHEDDEGDKEAGPVALSNEGFLPAKTLASTALLLESGFDLGELAANVVRVDVKIAIVRQINDSLLHAALRRQPTRRFLSERMSVFR